MGLRLLSLIDHLYLLSTGRTPLLWVAEYRHKAVIKLLPERGTDFETKDKESG